MKDDKFIQFLHIIRYFISPLEGILPLVYQIRDYDIYTKIVIVFINLQAKTTSDKNKELFTEIIKIIKITDLKNKLSSYVQNKMTDNSMPRSIINKPLYKTMDSKNDTDIDKVNYLLRIILSDNGDYIEINTSYNRAFKRNDENIDLTDEIDKQIKEFIFLFEMLNKKTNKKLDEKMIQIKASTEFFNAMNHLSISLIKDINDNDIGKKCIRRNLHQTQGHLSRAIKDMKKLDMYLCGFLDIRLEDFQERIKEVSPSNTGC